MSELTPTAQRQALDSWRRLLRRALDAAVTGLARLMLHVFFREVEVVGAERIPRGVPLVIVANHWNSAVDAILLLAVPGLLPRLLAKSTLWSHPVMRPLLTLAGALPVFRRQDPGVLASNNFATFARCREALAAGTNIALFPEGASHSQPHQLPLKTGAARIVLEAEADLGPLGVQILPVGLNYEAKDRFRSRVRVHVGPPLDPAAEVALHRVEPAPAVRALTARTAEALEAVTANRAWTALTTKSRARNIWSRAAQPLGALALLLCVLLNWLPYRLPGWISDRLSTSPEDPATHKLLAGFLIFPLAWLVETIVAAHLAGALWGLAVGIAAPLSGYAALRISEERRRC